MNAVNSKKKAIVMPVFCVRQRERGARLSLARVSAFSYLALVAGCPLPAVQLLIVEVEDDVLAELQSRHLRRELDNFFLFLPIIVC